MLSGGLAQPYSLARLPVRTLLDAFRLLLPDLEKTSGTDPLAGLFQVRHAASHAGERSVYRKSDLTAFATNDQISATYIWTQSVLGQRDYDPTKLTKKEISEDALPEEKKLVEYLIWGCFGEEDLLTFVSLKALLKPAQGQPRQHGHAVSVRKGPRQGVHQHQEAAAGRAR